MIACFPAIDVKILALLWRAADGIGERIRVRIRAVMTAIFTTFSLDCFATHADIASTLLLPLAREGISLISIEPSI